MGYKKKDKFRVKSHIKSFRDLEVYNRTTRLASQIYRVELPSNTKGRAQIIEEINKLKQTARKVPVLIAESYGDRYTNRQKAYEKLEKSAQEISRIITQIDFISTMINNHETKEELLGLVKKYQKQRVKILNLKKAWIRISKRFNK